MIQFTDFAIDPIVFSIGPVDVRWYGLSYVLGIFLAWAYSRVLIRRYAVKPMTLDLMDDFIVWATAGIIVGGRLGEVLFYSPRYYFQNPLEIIQIWHPGMSFHGGLIGVLLALVIFCRKYKIPFLYFADILAIVTPIGLFFGRIANFINGELFGRVTDVSWGIIFPQGGPYPRHPSQLYEALFEGLILFLVLFILQKFTKLRQTHPGAMGGVFLIGYGLFRGTLEIFREPDAHIGLFWGALTWGQILCGPLILGGLFLFWRSSKA